MDLKRLFEDRIRGLNICNTSTSPQNKLNKNTDRQNIPEKYRMCGEREQLINHLISECKKLAQKECK